MSKSRLNALQGVVAAGLTKQVEEQYDAFALTVADDEFEALRELYQYTAGLSHGPRPSPEAVSKALDLCERVPWDLIETNRRLAIALGNPPRDIKGDKTE